MAWSLEHGAWGLPHAPCPLPQADLQIFQSTHLLNPSTPMTTTDTKSHKRVWIPVWLIALLVPLIVSLLSFTLYQTKTQQDIINTLQRHDTDIIELKTDMKSRATLDQLNYLERYMIRIENKLDRVIEHQ